MTQAPQAPAASQAPPATPAAGPAEGGGRDWGIVLDIGGLVAGAVVVFVVADILTDGKLSARFRRPPPQSDGGPQ